MIIHIDRLMIWVDDGWLIEGGKAYNMIHKIALIVINDLIHITPSVFIFDILHSSKSHDDSKYNM